MLRLVTTACAAPTALGRFYQLGGRGELNWLDICGCTLDVVDASIAAGAATLGAGAIWKRIRSKAARTGQLLGLSVGYAAENILRLAAYAAVLRGAVPIYVLLFSTGDFLFVLLASCGCARHDRRGRGTRGRAFVRAMLWLYADMPLDFDRHRRMGWAHAVLVVGHAWLFGWACLFYREASPLARWCSTREAHLHLVLFLLSVKVVVFAGFWLAYAYESAGDARLEDHVVVTPLDLRKGDESSIELRSMFPTRRKPAAAASPRRPRASRDEAAGWWPRLSPRKSPRVAPADGGGAFLFNASPRVAPEGVPVRTQASLSRACRRSATRVEPIELHDSERLQAPASFRTRRRGSPTQGGLLVPVIATARVAARRSGWRRRDRYCRPRRASSAAASSLFSPRRRA